MTKATTPDYLTIGHISKDLLPDGHAPGGTAVYATLTAAKLGLNAAVVTSCAPGDMQLLEVLRDAGVQVHVAASPQTTTFRNVYDPQGRRTQILSARAKSIQYSDIPQAWLQAPIIHLGPIAQELPDYLPGRMPDSVAVLGITPQGWMRTWDSQGHVSHSATPVPEVLLSGLPPRSFIVTSIEDLGYDATAVADYVNLSRYVAITRGPDPASIFEDGTPTEVHALTGNSVDPTGAGDVFAATLFVYYRETSDLWKAARFAHAAAICNIEGQTISAIPTRETVVKRLADQDSSNN